MDTRSSEALPRGFPLRVMSKQNLQHHRGWRWMRFQRQPGIGSARLTGRKAEAFRSPFTETVRFLYTVPPGPLSHLK